MGRSPKRTRPQGLWDGAETKNTVLLWTQPEPTRAWCPPPVPVLGAVKCAPRGEQYNQHRDSHIHLRTGRGKSPPNCQFELPRQGRAAGPPRVCQLFAGFAGRQRLEGPIVLQGPQKKQANAFFLVCKN